MAEEKKRFPWWLVVCAVVLVPLAAVLGFIETVGRQGTLHGKCKQLRAGMTIEKVFAILGPKARTPGLAGGPEPDIVYMIWDDGPAPVCVELQFSFENPPHFYKELRLDPAWNDGPVFAWNDGPVVELQFSFENLPHFYKELRLDRAPRPLDFHVGCLERPGRWYTIRRWAEQAYTAIHGARR